MTAEPPGPGERSFRDDGFTNQLNIETIFQELDQNNVSWDLLFSYRRRLHR